MKNRKNLIINIILYAFFQILKTLCFENEIILEMFNSRVIDVIAIIIASAVTVLFHFIAVALFFKVFYAVFGINKPFEDAKNMSEKCLTCYWVLPLASFVLFLIGRSELSSSIYVMFGYIPFYISSVISVYRNCASNDYDSNRKTLLTILYAIVLVLLTIPGGLNE